MNKNKACIALAMASGIALAAASFVGATNTGFTAACNGVATGNSIQWTATAASGTAPYAYLWSGTNIASATSGVVTATYMPGTYTASLSITDASSSVATTTCSATIVQPVLVASCLGVVSGNNIQWTATATGGMSPYSYVWSGTGIASMTSSVASAIYVAGTYTASVSVTDASSTTISSSCSATVAVVPPPPPAPSTSTHQFFKQPDLNIAPNGNFTAHGMVVQSVSGNSFTGTVWGTTWTVNVSTSSGEWFLRGDHEKRGMVSISQIQVGDEVGVTGKVDPDHPLTVIGKVVRNYTIVTPRPDKHGESDKHGEGEGHNGTTTKEIENESSNHSRQNGSSTYDMQNLLQQLLKQMGELQGKFHSQRGDH